MHSSSATATCGSLSLIGNEAGDCVEARGVRRERYHNSKDRKKASMGSPASADVSRATTTK
jgi:hypothetical protein